MENTHTSPGLLLSEPVYTAGVFIKDGNPYLNIIQRKRFYRYCSDLSTQQKSNMLMMEDGNNDDLISSKNIITIPLSGEYYEERVVMCPVVIGVFDNILIIQHVTNKCQYLKFFLVDLTLRTVQYLKNLHHYFKRDLQKFVNLIGPVECHVSRCVDTVLLRLPGLVLSRHKWSTVFLMRDLERSESDVTYNSQYEIADLYQGDMREFDSQALCMDPRYCNRTLLALMKDNSSKCLLILLNVRKRSVVKERNHNLLKLFNVSDDENSKMCNLRLDFHIKQCDARYNKSGNIVIVSCWVINTNLYQEIQLFMFNSDTLALVSFYQYPMPQSAGVVQSPLQAPVFTDCDTKVVILGRRKHTNFCKWNNIVCATTMPKRLDLQHLCRSRIIQVLPSRTSVTSLPLPTRLIEFLKFQSPPIFD